VLGIVEDLSYEQIEAELPSGCTLAIFTDGLEEVLCQGGGGAGSAAGHATIAERAEAFIVELVQRCGEPRQAIATLEQYLDTRPGSLRPSDDSTLILLRRGE
jgi:serine phosphatase RsbU (regulator of sigma subunit)